MNKLFSSSLSYAETHYKFKLPWSPLFKPWPEIFIDGPSFCIPQVKPKFYIVVKDADYFPITINEVAITLKGQDGQTRVQYLGINKRINTNLVFLPIEINLADFRGSVEINGKISIESQSGTQASFTNTNFPGLPSTPLKIEMLSEALPYPEHWHAGELHCHSDYSNDPVEFGAPLKVLQEAGESLGLGYVVCTDHSYDFYYQKTRYMKPTNPDLNFENYRNEALALNQNRTETLPVMIPGEEVSCGNQNGENVHLLVAGYPAFIPGHGDGGRRWFNNRPDLRIDQVLELIGDTPCFAAHPKVKVGRLERFIFRRGMWHTQDLKPKSHIRGVNGLQFWNGSRKSDFKTGRQFWIEQLLAGKRLSPIGANDAHGDLNQNIGVKTPLFSLYQNRNHVFGHVRTVVEAKEKTEAGIQAGLKSENLFCTDGPFLGLKQNGGRGMIEVRSNSDFGGFKNIRLIGGRKGSAEELLLKTWEWGKTGPQQFSESCDCPADLAYIRSEVTTDKNRFALSSAQYL